jgi:ferrochelatase
MKTYLLVNFGGPRDLGEIRPFLTELLQDQDVVRTRFPSWLHRRIFARAAKRRAEQVRGDYEAIGRKSPIYEDTEVLAQKLSEKLHARVLTFHRYLPSTHAESIRAIEQCSSSEIWVIPCFPQFCYATTGSIARFFLSKLSASALHKLRWIHSYATHAAYISASQQRIREMLPSDNVLLLFSAHGIPEAFVSSGDIYETECQQSFRAIAAGFPFAESRLCYQSKFGKGEWLKPYTNEVCASLGSGKEVVVVPLSFTSDHIETLFEIEELYLPKIRAGGRKATRCPALNLEPYWVEALAHIAESSPLTHTQMLVRPS